MSEKRTVYFIMAAHPTQGRIRIGPAYGTRECARSWVPFVRASYRGMCRVTVEEFAYTLTDGKMSARDIEILDKKFNMDPPRDADHA